MTKPLYFKVYSPHYLYTHMGVSQIFTKHRENVEISRVSAINSLGNFPPEILRIVERMLFLA